MKTFLALLLVGCAWAQAPQARQRTKDDVQTARGIPQLSCKKAGDCPAVERAARGHGATYAYITDTITSKKAKLACMDEGGPPRTSQCTYVDDPCDEGVTPAAAVIVRTKDATMIELSDDEYAHLQALEQAVANEKSRLAVKYGARQAVYHPYIMPTVCVPEGCPQPVPDAPADAYTFYDHDRLLLIERR